jgi:hypothetical protein
MDRLLESLRHALGAILPIGLAAVIVVIIAMVLYRTLQEGKAEKSRRFESKLWDDANLASSGPQPESSSRRAEPGKAKPSSATGRKSG